jgi:hypothetical protein
VVLHVRDWRLDRIDVRVPGVLLPAIPTWWAYVKDRFVERTRDYPARVEDQRAKALALGRKCLAERELFCEERLAGFFAGTAAVLGDAAAARARLPDESVRKRFDEILALLSAGGKK